MTTCPNCQQMVDETTTILCPHCGARLNPAFGHRRWLLTPYPWMDTLLGVLLGFASLLLYGVGIFLTLILYFILRGTRPDFARGLLIAVITVGALILGLITLCFGGLALSSFGRF